MTYSGNIVWTITIAFKAKKNIKFLAGNAWGAFDYEDAGSGKIKWEGGNNFKTPAAAGTYTITLNENTQSVTIMQSKNLRMKPSCFMRGGFFSIPATSLFYFFQFLFTWRNQLATKCNVKVKNNQHHNKRFIR